ncbi:MAG: hypothetical protein CMJ72_08035 [Planctomycetaceae bacterium]|nr:hypothetical protein [Planctomycetaceae bacterium]MCH2595184.1 hypothetical protein [Pirellulales bacterium]HCK42719.1 hypothetical protein [Planctomycetaceae bacterium]|tara:strand:+ start:426 stop:1118 length:693 start_codon:yes stop_codon:yes gene_type:complete
MSFLKQFFTNVFHEESVAEMGSYFEQLSEKELEAHMGINRYDNYILTDAVRPSYNLEVVPSAGFRHDTYHDENTGQDVPVVMAAASREKLFDTFMQLLDPLGPTVDVVLECSHDFNDAGQQDLSREHIDMPILQSILWDFEDMLVNDGCTGIAVLNPNTPQEVQFDEHKLLIIYGKVLTPYEGVLIDAGLNCREDMKFVTEAEHVHSTNEDYVQQFEELKMRLGIDGGRF